LPPPRSPLFPYTTLFRSLGVGAVADDLRADEDDQLGALGAVALMPEGIAEAGNLVEHGKRVAGAALLLADQARQQHGLAVGDRRSEEHTSELQSRENLVC